MNVKLNWRHIVLFVVVVAALLWLTNSFLMSLGIVLLLFVADHFVQEWDEQRKNRK